MFGRIFAALILLAGCTAPARAEPTAAEQQAAWAAQCKDWDDWDKAGPPFKVYGNTYYVGTCGIAVILIAGDKQHVLIDSGPENATDIVLANIRALGFDPADIGMILQSHEHHDHVGGMAKIAAAAGEGVLANREVWQVYATGKPDPRDPQFAGGTPMTPVKVDGTVEGGMRVGVGGLFVNAVATPGHTPGALSWQWVSCEGTECKTIVYADSLSPVSSDGYKFSDHPEYLAAFRASIARLAGLECTILLSPHPSASHMRDRILGDGLTDARACKTYAEERTEQLDERLATEAGGQ